MANSSTSTWRKSKWKRYSTKFSKVKWNIRKVGFKLKDQFHSIVKAFMTSNSNSFVSYHHWEHSKREIFWVSRCKFAKNRAKGTLSSARAHLLQQWSTSFYKGALASMRAHLNRKAKHSFKSQNHNFLSFKNILINLQQGTES